MRQLGLQNSFIGLVLLGAVAFLTLCHDAFPADLGEAKAPEIAQQASAVQQTLDQGASAPERSGTAAPVNGKPAPTTSKNIIWRSESETFLSTIVLIFGALLFLAELVVINVGKYNADQSTKLLAVTLIIVGTLFIITAGFSSEQIAPAMGLFGTVAGYLLGRSQNEAK